MSRLMSGPHRLKSAVFASSLVAAIGAAIGGLASPADAGVSFSISVGSAPCAPSFHSHWRHRRVYCPPVACRAPVVVCPPPVACGTPVACSTPVVVYPQPVVVYARPVCRPRVIVVR